MRGENDATRDGVSKNSAGGRTRRFTARRVLVAHPRVERAQTLVGMLSQLGYEADSAATGNTAFRMATKNPDYEFVLLSDSLTDPASTETLSMFRRDPRTAGLAVGLSSTVDSVVDPVTRSVLVRALIPNDDGRLRPGLLMTVDLLFNERRALSVDERALIPSGRTTYVYVVEAGADGQPVASRREVRTGVRRVGSVEIVLVVELDGHVVDRRRRALVVAGDAVEHRERVAEVSLQPRLLERLDRR